MNKNISERNKLTKAQVRDEMDKAYAYSIKKIIEELQEAIGCAKAYGLDVRVSCDTMANTNFGQIRIYRPFKKACKPVAVTAVRKIEK